MNLFKLIKNLKHIDITLLVDYERSMLKEVIPEIIRDTEKRQILAIDARQRKLEIK